MKRTFKPKQYRCYAESCFEIAELRIWPRNDPKKSERLCWRHSPVWAKQGDRSKDYEVRICDA